MTFQTVHLVDSLPLITPICTTVLSGSLGCENNKLDSKVNLNHCACTNSQLLFHHIAGGFSIQTAQKVINFLQQQLGQ